MNFTIDDKKNLVKNIERLSINEQIEIFKIIKKSTDKYTINNNGVFINLSPMDNNLVEKIQNFVNYCNDIRKNDEEIQNEKNILLKSVENHSFNDEIITNTIPIIEQPIEQCIDKDMTDNTISLKRSKQKYVGSKAKIIKNIKK